jgi:hypothetical protein
VTHEKAITIFCRLKLFKLPESLADSPAVWGKSEGAIKGGAPGWPRALAHGRAPFGPAHTGISSNRTLDFKTQVLKRDGSVL